MYQDPTQQEAFERYNALPQHLKNALFAEENVDIVYNTAEENGLDKAQIQGVATLTGNVIFGFLTIEDLIPAIIEKIEIHPETAKIIGSEIITKVLNPIKQDLEALYGQAPQPKAQIPSTPPQPKQPTPTTPQPNQATPQNPPQIPSVQPAPENSQPIPPTPTENNPFIIHQESEGLQPIGSSIGSESLVKPYFYDSAAGTPQAIPEQQVKARLEIGDEAPAVNPSPEPIIGHTNEPSIESIRYSGPQVQVDPFSKSAYENPAPQNNEKSGEEINPDNIVDLKNPE